MPKKEITNEELARMIKKGFDGVDKRLSTLEQGQENIKLRLDNVAYQFQVQSLHQRLKILEKKSGIKSPAII